MKKIYALLVLAGLCTVIFLSAPVPTTVAVKVTLSPNVEGLRLEETVVSVSRLLTV